MKYSLFLIGIFAVSICIAQSSGGPGAGSDIAARTPNYFEHRSFANRTVTLAMRPQAIPEDAAFYNTRLKQYSITGETPVRGTIEGFDEFGDVRFKGSYLRDHLYGTCVSLHPNGVLRDSGNMVYNLPEGTWYFYYPDGKLKSVRNYDAYMWWALEWSIQLQNPYWNNFALSDLYQQNKTLFRRAVVASETFNDKYSPLFEYCVQNGKTIDYYPNGQVADSGTFYKGLREGLWLYYHEDGKLKTKGGYTLGKKTGSWVSYYPSGNLQKLEIYRRGDLIESKEYSDEPAN